MNKEKCEKVERNVNGTMNKDVGKNPNTVYRFQQLLPRLKCSNMYIFVEPTQCPSAGKHRSHSIRISYKCNQI